MTELIKKIIDTIKDGQESQIKLTIEDGKQMHLNCKFKKAESPHFYLVFPSNSLPQSIDIERTHPVTIPYLKNSMSLSARIVSILDDTTLELIAKETVDPARLREYFRVDVSTAIEASYEVKKGNPKNNWTMAGTTQDLSATGVLALFPKEPLNFNHIFLKIKIPDSDVIIRAIGRIIRKRPLRKGRWQVSFHFDQLSEKHREELIKCCFSQQRKHLRSRIHTLD